ncbi:MAG: hypothetical protein JSS32_08305 [Verrucomicrobia bacterium]|nr:hypothetical protein [Verrucomicrobiota bacterium]
MPTEVLFSIAILVKKNLHLLPLTLESLASQNDRSYEVLLVDGVKTGRVEEMARGLPVQILKEAGETEAELMNRALGKAKGEYIQFLRPGDRYISQHALSYLTELIRDSERPELVYCAFLERDLDGPPQAVSFPINAQTLKKGTFPTMYRSSWFLKETVVGLGGFNHRLNYRPSFDLLCRFFLKGGLRAVYTRRVLTDYEPLKNSPRAIAGYAFETCRILYRHFGLKSALRWLFDQDHSRMIRWMAHLLRHAFQKDARL